MRIRPVLAICVAVAATTLLAGFGVDAASAAAHPYRLGPDGTTTAVYSYAAAIRETVWVDIGLDQDGDGVGDRVAVDIIRPSEPATAHEKIPAIMDTSGYYQKYGRGNEDQIKTYDRGRPVQFPLFLDNYFVPRGYAVVLPDLAGTNRSTGCTDFGGPSELASSTRTIDWLNGRAPGYTSRFGSTRADAGWASGSVGMIGKSWDGQNVIETSVTGIAGLDAVVPEAGIASDYEQWYLDTGTANYVPTTADYTTYFTGLQNRRALLNVHCRKLLADVRATEPLNGDYTEQWDKRNWAKDAGRVRAAVLMVQGQNDTTVSPTNVGLYWPTLPASLPKKLWLSETGHVDPFDFRRVVWVDTLHRWFDRFLYKIHNGIENTPQLSVERAPTKWVDYDSFPAAGTATRSLHPTPGSDLGTGGLQTKPGKQAVVTVPSGAGASFATPALAAPLRLSGEVSARVTLNASVTGNATVVAVVHDLGRSITRGFSGSPDSNPVDVGIREPNERKSCWGESIPGDSACFFVTPADVITTDSIDLGFGARDLRHAASIRSVQRVTAGTTYSLDIPTETMDRILPEGHRLGLDIYVFGPTRATYQVDLTRTAVNLPVVGGTFSFTTGASIAPMPQVRLTQPAESPLRTSIEPVS